VEGWTRLRYFEAVGFHYASGRSALPVTRGAVATASLWPGEADERFLLALTEIPEREGRATVFGRVVDGWATLEALERAPVDKSHRTLDPVFIRRIVERKPQTAPAGADQDDIQ
jgi:cyclophilin family peptidyl-prolyl cis-trans isomerase